MTGSAREPEDDCYNVAAMTVLDHLGEAARLMEGPSHGVDDYNTARADNVRTAEAHIAFAQVLLLTTIKDNRMLVDRVGISLKTLRERVSGD